MKSKKIQKFEITMEVGEWVQVSLEIHNWKIVPKVITMEVSRWVQVQL